MARKNKVRGNKYVGLAVPQSTLDYHDQGPMTAEEIREMARDFLEDCLRKGARKALIITGKGIHSLSGPVIGPTLREYLPSLPFVRSIVTARRDRGGEGALELELG